MERERYPFRVEYGGQVLTGHFWHPSRFTGKGLEIFRRMAASGPAMALVVFVAASVADWDMTTHGEPVPVTEEALMPIPLLLLREVRDTILERANQEGLLLSLN